MMRTIIFVFISVILESRGYGKIVGDCSPQVDMPCTLHKLTGNDCSPVNLRTEFPFFETNTAKFPGKPGSFDAVGSYRYYPTYNRWYPEVNLTFTAPQNTGKNYVKGFEVTRYDASSSKRPTCYILDLSNVIWDENSVADMHTKFRLDLYPLNPADPRYFAFEVYALPKQENREDRFDQYLQKFIQFPVYIPVNDRSPRNWLAMIYYTKDSNLGTINVTIEQPPAEYNFTLFEYSLVHSGSIVPFILEKSKKTWYQFKRVPTGVYKIWVKPVKDEGHCPCKDVTGQICDHCTKTMTKNFSFNYSLF
ncbi:uncharacterized protein LOC128549922 [Mercenaria mercenaria]|uniref:uncharacterized protein LOC128549922 n=1 Tax=Mercenaria mercenaria TaxID=6596 RepID=UPI00234EE405|nr:uncharacterized protein LOC128549922 [Mercenaria mercenaria]